MATDATRCRTETGRLPPLAEFRASRQTSLRDARDVWRRVGEGVMQRQVAGSARRLMPIKKIEGALPCYSLPSIARMCPRPVDTTTLSASAPHGRVAARGASVSVSAPGSCACRSVDAALDSKPRRQRAGPPSSISARGRGPLKNGSRPSLTPISAHRDGALIADGGEAVVGGMVVVHLKDLH